MTKLKARTIFAFLFYGTFCYLIIRQMPIPKELVLLIGTIQGYYFGNKAKIKGE